MSSLSKWHRAVMRDKLGALSKGDRVFIVVSTVKYSHPHLNPSYWVVKPKDKIAYQVAEHEFGARLHKLLQVTEELESERQDQMTDIVKGLLCGSAFAPRNRKRQTYFFGNRPNNTTRISNENFGNSS